MKMKNTIPIIYATFNLEVQRVLEQRPRLEF